MIDPAAPPADAQVTVRPRRRGGSPTDMVRSLGLVGIGVVGMVAFSFFGQPHRPPVTVDVAATVQAARAGSDLPVLAATTLPAGVYANTARFTSVTGETGHANFFIGYTDGAQAYVSIEVSDATGAERLQPPAAASGADREVAIAGVSFSHYAGSTSEEWFHAATPTEPYAAHIMCNSSAVCDAVLRALRIDGPVQTGL